ncbi:hypothetical protein A9Q84_03135 [Halobacteriovorax marinus]|uniref:Endonuclease I n=1 Tax=Halobacteriovorax marinus TaxID=97084 RepID=A0A1Y5FD16_9BACT|nr:hypothetical protein A9Q84_03135 [Halobacteriovorax marinus]
MKLLLILVQLCIFSQNVSASTKTKYYRPTALAKFTGYALKTELKRIITATHSPNSYGQLYKVYLKSDLDNTYDGDNSIVDIYSERVGGRDSYNYSNRSDMCGSYKKEGDCINREHLFPQSIFNKRAPMRADFFHVFPTDGYVNGRRGRLPFGEVRVAHWSSKNGSKVGKNSIGKYTGQVFEPIDEFKGDVARALLYFAIRYEDRVASWDHVMLNGTSDQVYATWFLKILLKWHKQDPVSAHEIKRNDHGYKFQGNRNPLIDYPKFAMMIWGNTVSN